MKDLLIVTDPRGIVSLIDHRCYPAGTPLDQVPANDFQIWAWQKARQVGVAPQAPSPDHANLGAELRTILSASQQALAAFDRESAEISKMAAEKQDRERELITLRDDRHRLPSERAEAVSGIASLLSKIQSSDVQRAALEASQEEQFAGVQRTTARVAGLISSSVDAARTEADEEFSAALYELFGSGLEAHERQRLESDFKPRTIASRAAAELHNAAAVLTSTDAREGARPLEARMHDAASKLEAVITLQLGFLPSVEAKEDPAGE